MFDIMGKPANLSLSRNAALNNVFLCLFNPVKDKIIIR